MPKPSNQITWVVKCITIQITNSNIMVSTISIMEVRICSIRISKMDNNFRISTKIKVTTNQFITLESSNNMDRTNMGGIRDITLFKETSISRIKITRITDQIIRDHTTLDTIIRIQDKVVTQMVTTKIKCMFKKVNKMTASNLMVKTDTCIKISIIHKCNRV